MGVLGEAVNVHQASQAALAPAVQMSWRWLCVWHVKNPLQESLNQAGASLDLKETVCTDSGQRERKSGLKAKC